MKDASSATKEDLVRMIMTLRDQVQRGMGGNSSVLVPRPSPFSGERGGVQTFLTQARAYIYASEKIKSPEDKILSISGMLMGAAAEWWEPILRDHVTNSDDNRKESTKVMFSKYSNFESALRNTFGNPDEQRNAVRRMMDLRQKGSAGFYAIEFQRLASKMDWGDSALIEQFYKGLREDVKDDISREKRPNTLTAFVDLAIQIDNRLYERRQERKGHGWHVRPNDNRPNQGRKYMSTAYGTHPGPMDLDAT
jgi:hypothetical protein